MTKHSNPWQIHLKKVYDEMKKKDNTIKLQDAMKVAAKSYKR